jgi:hypothetical protein
MSQPKVYFDTDTFHHFAATYQDRPLPVHLRGRIVLSPYTMLEVFSHLVWESTQNQLRGIVNWIVEERTVPLMAWPDEQITEMVFGIQPKGDWFLMAVAKIITDCFMEKPSWELEDIRELQDKVTGFKEQRANYFPTLVECCRNHPELVTNFGGEWLKCVVPGLKELKLNRHGEAQLLEALSAYHEFEVEKLKVAIANPSYNPSKHKNVALDARQLAYLCDCSLHFLVCDNGYLTKVRQSEQRNRIHQTSQETLSDPDKTEALLSNILGSTE